MTAGVTSRAIISVSTITSGKKYAEVVFDNVLASFASRECVGIGSFVPVPDCLLVGITDGVCIAAHTDGTTSRLHKDTEGAADGFSTGGPAITNGMVCNIAFDVATGKVWLGLNGTYYYDIAGTMTAGGSPSAGTNPTLTTGLSTIHIGAGSYREFSAPDPGAKFTLRIQSSQFTGTIPSGFSAWYP